MKFAQTVLTWMLVLAVAVSVGGIVNARAVNSPHGFDPSWMFATARWLLSVVFDSAADSVQQEENPEPFSAIAQDTAQEWSEFTQEQIDQGAQGQRDPRLAVCPEGSVAHTYELALEKAQQGRDRSFTNLVEVQALYGEPNCNIQQPGGSTQWRFLVEGFRIVDAVQRDYNAPVQLEFTNF